MPVLSLKKEQDFLSLYEKFISDSQRGKRLQPNGRRIGQGTVANYVYTLKLLQSFSSTKNFQLRIRSARYLNSRELQTEKNYWKKFYRQFSDYLYKECGHFDNYVGQTFKNIRVFFNYLNKELALGTGEFHKLFYVRKEEIAIFPLMPEELNFLIYDKDFEESLSRRLQETKDFFVFGCTVALRVSDLLNLRKTNIRVINEQHYLAVRSIKTKTDTLIKLPSYAVAILQKYRKRKALLPHFNKVNLNKFIKRLLEQAGFTAPVLVTRERKGEDLVMKRQYAGAEQQLRFCDVATTHTMRRTAITTMLSLGVPEQVVRKISGHAPGSKEFYRYVLWSQTYQDQETEKVFEKLQEKKLMRA
jgi:integrase